METYDDGRVVDVDGYVHVVDGKAICFERHVFDLSSAFARTLLVKMAGLMAEGEIRVVEPAGGDSGSFLSRIVPFDDLSVPVQAAIRRGMARGKPWGRSSGG